MTGHSAGGAIASLLYAHMLAEQTGSELGILADCKYPFFFSINTGCRQGFVSDVSRLQTHPLHNIRHTTAFSPPS